MKSAFLELGLQWFHKTSFVDLKGIVQLHKTKEMGERLLDLFHHHTILYRFCSDIAFEHHFLDTYRYPLLIPFAILCNTIMTCSEKLDSGRVSVILSLYFNSILK